MSTTGFEPATSAFGGQRYYPLSYVDVTGKVVLMSRAYPWVRVQETLFRSAYGTFRLRAYEFPDGREHSALIAGDPQGDDHAPLIRAQSACLTGTAFGALLCDCRQQLELSLRQVKSASAGGVVLYLDQEGRGHGLVEKVRQLSLIAGGLATTADAAGKLAPDVRDYEAAFAILDDVLGRRATIWLLTNNPTKLSAFQGAGYEVLRMPVESTPTDDNRGYLLIKKQDMGHLLTSV